MIVRAALPIAIAAVALSCAPPAGINPPPSTLTLESERDAALESRPPEPAPAVPEPSGSGKVTRIALGDLFALQQANAALIFDVRPAIIYRLGHIPGAVSWPKSSFQTKLSLHEPEIRAARAAGKPVVLYCVDLACPDARTVAYQLSGLGHSVTVLEGGWDAWKAGDLPSE